MPPKIKRTQGIETAEVLAELLSKASNSKSLINYTPHAKQKEFHSAQTQLRLYLGGNRAGKTVGGIIEDIWWLTKTHPYREIPAGQIRGRYVAPDFPNGVEKIALPMFKQWLPVSTLINGKWDDSWSASKRTLTLANGNFIEFMSNDQETDAFAGTSRHFIHYDEEPDKRVFVECSMRLIDVEGSAWITMTPVEGMTWVYEELWENRDINSNLTVITVDMDDNPYLSEAGKAIALQGLDSHELLARKQGRFVALTGLIFRNFDHTRHVLPPVSKIISPEYFIYESMDHGFNNPTAWLWHYVRSDGVVVTFKEHYAREMTVDQHADKVKEIRRTLKHPIQLTVGDPSISQRNAVTGNSIQTQYALNSVRIALANNDVQGGINKMNSYINQNKWFVTEDCVNLLKELRKYRWKTWDSSKTAQKNDRRDEPHKKDDHAIDSVRYMFSFMPDLAPESPAAAPDMSYQHMEMLGAKLPFIVHQGGYGFTLPVSTEVKTEWTHVDEHLGGLF